MQVLGRVGVEMEILKEVIIRYQTEDGRTVKAYEQEKVIRCKDCEFHREAHYEEDGEKPIIKHKCKLLKGYQFSENHYCGFARRKEQ